MERKGPREQGRSPRDLEKDFKENWVCRGKGGYGKRNSSSIRVAGKKALRKNVTSYEKKNREKPPREIHAERKEGFGPVAKTADGASVIQGKHVRKKGRRLHWDFL